MRIKICGITNIDDARAAVDAGAEALGFILYPPSPRYVAPTVIADIMAELPPFVSGVGVFVDEPIERVTAVLAEAGLHYAQLHGGETPSDCAALGRRRAIKALRLRRGEEAAGLAGIEAYHRAAAAILLDTFHPALKGGTGESFNWGVARAAGERGPVILSGGLTPENVAEAVRAARPFGVDVASGVEAMPGRKDHAKVYAFVAAARRAEAEIKGAQRS